MDKLSLISPPDILLPRNMSPSVFLFGPDSKWKLAFIDQVKTSWQNWPSSVNIYYDKDNIKNLDWDLTCSKFASHVIISADNWKNFDEYYFLLSGFMINLDNIHIFLVEPKKDLIREIFSIQPKAYIDTIQKSELKTLGIDILESWNSK